MLKILLVDDMKHFLNLEKSFLKRSECEILTAMTGLEAIKTARLKKPDIIMLDVEMPEMNGIEAARILKNLSETRNIPVVIITSLNVKDEAIRAGANSYFQKPVDEDTFISIIQHYLPLPVRQDIRMSSNIKAKYNFQDKSIEAKIIDISKSGCYVKSDLIPPVGELIRLNFSINYDSSEKHYDQDAYVVRVTENGFGCSFFELSTGSELFLEEYVANLAKSTN